MKRESWLYLAAIIGGAIIWAFVAGASGKREAWDSELYFSVAIPCMCVLSMVLAYCEPARSWRWGVLPSAGQFGWMLLAQGPGNLLPLGIIAFGVFSIPSVIAARIGAAVRVARAARDRS